MKKIISLLLALSMLFVLCACGASEPVDPETILHSHEWWTAVSGDSEVNITFYENGTGMMTAGGSGFTYHWNFIDDDTIKINVDYNGYHITLDVVDDKGDHQLVNSDNGVVSFVPYQ